MSTPAGWYDDGSGQQRWFDGHGWTEQTRSPRTADVSGSAPPSPSQQKPTASQGAGGLAVAALVTGVIAFFTGIAPVWGILAGGSAVALGIVALVRGTPRGKPIVGIVLGGLALLTSVMTTIGMLAPQSAAPASSASSATPVTTSSETTPTPIPEPTAEVSQTPEAPSPAAFTMPSLVGKNLQEAKNELQALGSAALDQRDASGQGRTQILDSNWKVCAQEPATGQKVATTTTVVLSSVKNEEPCPGDAPKVAGIGDAVRVGDLAVTVSSAERKSKLTSVFGTKKGHWMLVTVKITNKGKEQVMVNDSDFTLTESDGTTYSTDSDGMTYIDSDDWLFLEKINPKISATGKVLFAIPKSAKNLTLQVSTGLFGDTVEISLGKK